MNAIDGSMFVVDAEWNPPDGIDEGINMMRWQDYDFGPLSTSTVEVRATHRLPDFIDMPVTTSPSTDNCDRQVYEEIISSSEMKRKAQNRAAQRAFRERKECQMKQTRDEVTMLRNKLKQVETENAELQKHVTACARNDTRLKRIFAAMQRDLLAAAETLDASPDNKRGATHRVLILGVLACLRSVVGISADDDECERIDARNDKA